MLIGSATGQVGDADLRCVVSSLPSSSSYTLLSFTGISAMLGNIPLQQASQIMSTVQRLISNHIIVIERTIRKAVGGRASQETDPAPLPANCVQLDPFSKGLSSATQLCLEQPERSMRPTLPTLSHRRTSPRPPFTNCRHRQC
jgi:hypothetical protein